MRNKNLNRLLFAHININSIRNKFDQVLAGIKNNIDVLMISETKLDSTFPKMQFHFEEYCVYRLDRNEHGVGILVYVREDIPSKLIPMQNSSIEGLFIELNLRSKKWLSACSYNPHRSLISEHLSITGKNLDLFSAKYENIFLMGDLNAEPHDSYLKDFCDIYSLKNLIKVPTCFKNPDRPTCIDVMLTSSYRSFHNSCVVETGISDFHKMTVTVMKTHFKKREPKVIQYRDFSNFLEIEYREFLIELAHDPNQSYEMFLQRSKEALDIRAPLKSKYLRSNHSPFMNKDISKAIMNCTRLRNKFWKSRSDESKLAYNKQRNYCLSLARQTKRVSYNNLDHKNIIDNKSFWKHVKPILTDKNPRSNKITLVENESIIEEPDKIAETFNNFFANAVSNLNIPRYVDSSASFNHFDDEILCIVGKYKNQPSVVAIKNKNIQSQFSFRPIPKTEIYKEILNLDISKAPQDSNIPTKVVRGNADIFAEVLFTEFERSLEIDNFITSMKIANVTPVHKKGSQSEKGNYRPVSILPNLSKVFERCIYKQISEYFENILSKYQCGFRKGHSAQHCLIALLEK